MKRKNRPKNEPLIRLVGWNAGTAALTGLAASAALAAPGDLDPSFGDVGRQSVNAAWFESLRSIEVGDDDSVLFGGGGEYEYWGLYIDNFIDRLLPDGRPDAGFAASVLAETAVYDTALQSDGKVVGVGTSLRPSGAGLKLVVFRLGPDGALDPGFGLGGLTVVSEGTAGRSVAIDADGRIVVAGLQGSKLLVARLLPNGSPDASFATAGLYLGDTAAGDVRVAVAPSGGYRVAANIAASSLDQACRVIGLTDAGTLDVAFGSAGIVTPPTPGNGTPFCASMAVQSDGRILLGGENWSGLVAGGYVGRLLPNGSNDSGFNAVAVASQFESVTAVTASAAGAVYVAGRDPAVPSGGSVVRLLADGTLDALFGQAGAASVPLRSRRSGRYASINDMKVDGSGRLVIGGGSGDWYDEGNAFVARLLGDTGGGPGVISLQRQRGLGSEQDGKIVLSAHRTGGSSGAVSVTYSTRDFPAPPAEGSNLAPGARAKAGEDYTVTTGQLTWADGDTSDRQIEVPIALDDYSEAPEFFEVALESSEGGAGLGTFGADAEIAGSSYPAGEFTIQASSSGSSEGGTAVFYVYRNSYRQGEVSVTVRVADGGSATPGQDFGTTVGGPWVDQVLTWRDGQMGVQMVNVLIARDDIDESAETFTLELTSPTGGAALGDVTRATKTVLDVYPSTGGGGSGGGSGSSGGGGSFGWLGAALLGLAGLARRLTRRPAAGRVRLQ
jgi:uncharacterized delta-60 repeat protein